MSPADVVDGFARSNELPAHLHRSGWTVALRDLHRRRDLNGVEGAVHAVAHHEGRVCVCLDTGEYVRVRPENITILRTGPLVSLGGIVRAHRASQQEKTTGARCPTEKERKIAEDLMLSAAAHAAQEHESDATGSATRGGGNGTSAGGAGGVTRGGAATEGAAKVCAWATNGAGGGGAARTNGGVGRSDMGAGG